MNFKNPDEPVSSAELADIEIRLGFRLPQPLKQSYLNSNGGSPEPYVYEDDNLDTVVSAFMPITSSKGNRTSVQVYEHLVLAKKIVPSNLFPFAVDGGGDYFFVDCLDSASSVYFLRSDSTDDHLIPLGMDPMEFWGTLKPEQ